MKAKDTSGLFDIAKQVPTELSKTAVLDLIKTIPALPPPSSNWFQNFNLNSILMTTTAITLITSAVIYFTAQTSQQELSGPELQPQLNPVEITDSTEQSPKIQFKSIQLDTIKDEVIEIETKTTIDVSTIQEEDSIVGEETVIINQVTSVKPVSKGSKSRLSSMPKSSIPQYDVENIKQDRVKLSARALRGLKKTFLKYLKQDNLLVEKDVIGAFNTIKYTKENISANDVMLENEMYQRYLKVLNKYNITPGPDRRVVLTKSFIQVGDFTDKGFDGSALGKNMEIYFLEMDKINRSSLFAKDSSMFRIVDGFSKYKKSPEDSRNEDIILKTEGRVKDAEINLSKIDRLFRDSENYAPPKDGNRFFDSGDKGISIFTKDTENTYIELNGKRLKGLKKELYRELQNDKLIKNKKADVRLILNPSGIFLDKEEMPYKTSFRYQRILEKYGIGLANNRKILMSVDFIVVGDFVNNNFNGSVKGSLNSEDLKESIFQQDFEDFHVFGFSKAVNK